MILGLHNDKKIFLLKQTKSDIYPPSGVDDFSEFGKGDFWVFKRDWAQKHLDGVLGDKSYMDPTDAEFILDNEFALAKFDPRFTCETGSIKI